MNALSPIVTPFGILIDLREVHPANADSPISVTDSGITIDFSDMQPEKQYESIFVMDSLNFIFFSEVHPVKDPFFRYLTVFGILIFTKE